jgi:N6-L-threonylcarbamoyladenine synthase
MIILGIETSCDDTAASVMRGEKNRLTILSHLISSQITTLKKYGGVVPEVAARQHIVSIMPTIDLALRQARVAPKDIDVIAVTAGPGLITALRVGVQTAKTLAYVWNTKLIGLNHIEGHIYANWYEHPELKFPSLCLVVSGGHTELVLMKGHDDYHLVGRTRDDAAGEAFDKVAKLLNIGFPGGPKIQQLARTGDAVRFDFPRPMLKEKNYDFSFSGLKTAVLYFVKKEFVHKKLPLADICASFQQAVIDVLVAKTIRAAKEFRVKSVLVAGGVAANQPLRQQLKNAIATQLDEVAFSTPPVRLCTDNGSMIAVAGYYHAKRRHFSSWKTLEPNPNWELV